MLLDKSQSGRKNCRICTEMAQSQRQEHVVKDYDKGDGGEAKLGNVRALQQARRSSFGEGGQRFSEVDERTLGEILQSV